MGDTSTPQTTDMSVISDTTEISDTMQISDTMEISDNMEISDTMEISYADVATTTPKDINEMWVMVEKMSVKKPTELPPVRNRRSWRTIRIFVSSTFRDFMNEREVLVKELFPDLRLWCEERKLRLIECDLKWGVPAGTAGSDTIQICLGELDRCYEENHMPFFLNLCAERVGWVPEKGTELPDNLAAHYGWVHGLSVTEMEIVHGALRKLNPNALFMIREPESLTGLPDHVIEYFQENGEMYREKLSALKTKIADVFPSNHHYYKVKGSYENENVRFEGLEGEFYQKIFNFFKERIDQLYPLDTSPEDPFEVHREQHETFMETRAKCVLGRDTQLDEIRDYITKDESGSPFILVGNSGSGKSSIMARSAKEICTMVESGECKAKVFCHFVGATPGSTDLASFLKRLVNELQSGLEVKDNPTDLNGYMQTVLRLLSTNSQEQSFFIFVDAINQMDEDKQYYLARWLPCQLAPNIRVVMSTIDNTETHSILKKFVPSPPEVVVGPLDEESRKEIVTNILRDYTKVLHQDQMTELISKKGSSNPLWLAIACEELRVEATFETVTSMIQGFPDDLIDIEVNLIKRLVGGENGELLKAALAMLEVSRYGLLETELLALLARKDILKMGGSMSGLTTESVVSLRQKTRGYVDTIPARDWAVIYRNIKQLLRPCGNLGDGRLDFYHRSLSKAVRKVFLGVGNTDDAIRKDIYDHWHRVLADFFADCTDMNRKAEEMPYHLEQLADDEGLVKCLVDWEIFDCLYDDHFAVELIRFWKAAGGYKKAAVVYKESLSALREQLTTVLDDNERKITSKREFSAIQYKVANFLRVGGEVGQAYELMKECVAIEEEEGAGEGAVEGVLHLAQVCHWMAYCKRTMQYTDATKEQKIEGYEEAVRIYKKSNDYLLKVPGEESDILQGRNNCGMAHVMLKIAQEKGVDGSDEFLNETLPLIDSSVDVLEKYNEIRYLIDALGTQSQIYPKFEEKKAIRVRAIDLALRTFGEVHDLFVSKSRNYGTMVSKAGDYDSAYYWYDRSYAAALKLYGADHSYTKLIERHLQEPNIVAAKTKLEEGGGKNGVDIKAEDGDEMKIEESEKEKDDGKEKDDCGKEKGEVIETKKDEIVTEETTPKKVETSKNSYDNGNGSASSGNEGGKQETKAKTRTCTML